MIRVVLVVLLTVALLAVVLPGVEEGRVERTATRLDADATRLDRAARALYDREDPTSRGVAGARRFVRVDLHPASWGDAGVGFVAVGGPPSGAGDEPVVVYRLRGRDRRTVPLTDVPIRTPNGPVVFRGAGTHRVRLTLVTDSRGPTVSVTEAGG